MTYWLRLTVLLIISASSLSGVFGQQLDKPDQYVPEELQGSDSEVRAKLASAQALRKAGKYNEAFAEDQQSLSLAMKKGFSGDIGLAEDAVASADFISGRVQDGWNLDRDAIQKAIDSSNLVLQADILTTLSSECQSTGNLKGALSLVSEALNAAEKSKNLYIKSRVLGEMGRLQLLLGEKEDAGRSLDEALRIDSINHYPLHSLHLVYEADLLLSDNKSIKSGVQQLEKARNAAISERNFSALFMAESALGTVYVYTGEIQRGLDILQSMSSGNAKIDSGAMVPGEFRSVLALPFVKMSFLEALGNAYETAKKPADAINTWSQLYSFSTQIQLPQAMAEAAQHLGSLYFLQGDAEDGAKYYRISADQWRNSGNDTMLTQSLAGQALCLAKSGRSTEALAVDSELAEVGIRLNNRRIQFVAYLSMAETYEPANEITQERTVLEKAQALIDAAPNDPAFDYKSASEAYLRLGTVYNKLGDQQNELVALEKGLVTNIIAKDQKLIDTLVPVIQHKFDAIHVEDLISNLYKSHKLLDALIYSQLLYVFKGIPPSGKSALYTQLMVNIPFQLLSPEGAEGLEKDLHTMGSILGFEELPVLDALSQYYVFAGNDPAKGRDYALQAIALIDTGKTSGEALRMRPACLLAVGYARTAAADLANQTLQQCMDLAKKSDQAEDKAFANTADVFVRAYESDIKDAKESLVYLKRHIAASPSLDEQLALALGKGGEVSDGMAEFTIALQAYQNIHDSRSIARCYIEMADVLAGSDSKDSKQKQLEFLRNAARLDAEIGDKSSEVATELAIGQYFSKLTRKQDAEKSYRQALDLSEKSGNELGRGWASQDLGDLYSSNRQPNKAAKFHKEAADAFRDSQNRIGEAYALTSIGQDMEAMHRSDEALASYIAAESMVTKNGPPSSEYFVEVRIGSFYQRRGSFEEARRAFLKAEQVTTDANDVKDLAWSHMMLGELDELEGDSRNALEEFTASETAFHKLGNTDGESSADADLAALYSDRNSSVKDFDAARKYFALAQNLHYDKIRELDDLEIDIQTKNFSDAMKVAKETLSTCQATDSNCIGHGLISLAEAERLSGDLKESSATLNRAKSLVTKDQDIYLRGRFLYAEANQERASGHFAAAVTFYEQTVKLIEDTKEDIDAQFQVSLSDTYDFVYDELIDSLFSLSEQQGEVGRAQSAEKALNYAERNKARLFDKSWGQTFISGLGEKIPSDVLQQENTLTSRLNQLSSETTVQADSLSQSVSDHQRQLDAAQSELDGLVQKLRRKYPAYAALKYPEPATFDALPLHAEETLVEFKVTDTATFVWIIRNESRKTNSLVSFYKVSKGREWLDEQVSRFRDAFNSGQPTGYDSEVSAQLFKTLFPGEHANDVLEARRLIFIPDDILSLVPFEMLSPDASQNKYPLLTIPTKYFPAAESLRIARTARRSTTWQDAFLGVGDPVTSPEDPRYPLIEALSHGESSPPHQVQAPMTNVTSQVDSLRARGFEFDALPGTKREIESIAGLFSEKKESTDVLLGMTATRKNILDLDLSKFRYIHFATHGVLPIDAGIREPSLVLSYDGTSADKMLLSVSTIIGLNIDADDVVLSACNTGSGQVSRAEGVMSLGRAFMNAGASSVTVSLWEVADASTALLMKEYYRNLLLGKPKDEALADARTWLFRNGYKNPYNWAPFVLIGE